MNYGGNDSIVNKTADKGGIIIEMNASQYEHMCLDILQNAEWYMPISETVIVDLNDRYHSIVNTAYNMDTNDKIGGFLRLSQYTQAGWTLGGDGLYW